LDGEALTAIDHTLGRQAGGHSQRRPLAEVLCDAIARDLIFSDEVSPGKVLPSEKELASRYGVSRPTVREALLMLQLSGLVAMRHGVGSFVLPRSRSLTNGLDRLCSIETFAREAGQTIESEELEFDEVEADAEMAGRLQIPMEHKVLVVRRVKLLGGVRVGWIHDHIPEGVLTFDLLRSEFQGSTLDVILDHPEVGAEFADSEIEPLALPAPVASRLGVKAGTSGLMIDTVVWTLDGQAVDWGRCWYLPKYFRFSVRRRRQIGQRVPDVEERFASRRAE
jgi:GntR family transcriptional regulator